jgi:hypothetical protein
VSLNRKTQRSIQEVQIDLTDNEQSEMFGDLVYLLHKITGVSPEQVAAHAGISTGFAKSIQQSRGSVYPCADVGQLILEAFGITTTRIGPLLTWEDGKNFIRFKTASRRNPKMPPPSQDQTILHWT